MFKYVKTAACPACKHGGVETEWETMCVATAFNIYDDGDACCVGSMANSAFWSNFPLPDSPPLVQPAQPPSVADLVTQGFVDPNGTVRPFAFAAFYAGDYDSAAWLSSQLQPLWDDGGRGKVPIGWAIDGELSLRFPPIFPYLYRTATALDVFISGDSGAGYLNPTQLLPPRAVSGITESGGPLWIAWNSKWYKK